MLLKSGARWVHGHVQSVKRVINISSVQISKLSLACLFALALLLAFVAHHKRSNIIIFDGDSVVAGYPDNAPANGTNVTFPNGTDFPSDVMRQLDTTWTGFNEGVSSRELSSTPEDNHVCLPGFTTQVDDFEKYIVPIVRQAYRANWASHIIVMNGGEPGNMLYFYTMNHGQGGWDAQEAAYSALRTYADKVHKTGALFVDITMPARVLAGAANQNLQADIDALNIRIRNNCVKDGICDSVIALDTDARMQTPADERYYVDGTHFTAEGYSVWADYVVKALRQTRDRWYENLRILVYYLRFSLLGSTSFFTPSAIFILTIGTLLGAGGGIWASRQLKRLNKELKNYQAAIVAKNAEIVELTGKIVALSDN